MKILQNSLVNYNIPFAIYLWSLQTFELKIKEHILKKNNKVLQVGFLEGDLVYLII